MSTSSIIFSWSSVQMEPMRKMNLSGSSVDCINNLGKYIYIQFILILKYKQVNAFFCVKKIVIMFHRWNHDSLSLKIQQSLIRANKFKQFPRGINTLLQSVWDVTFDDSWYRFYDSVLYLHEIYQISWRKKVRWFYHSNLISMYMCNLFHCI